MQGENGSELTCQVPTIPMQHLRILKQKYYPNMYMYNAHAPGLLTHIASHVITLLLSEFLKTHLLLRFIRSQIILIGIQY